MKTRICILGLPRSGSQYVASLIRSSTRGMLDLAEPFTNRQSTRVALDDNNQVIKWEEAGEISMEDRVEKLLTTLEAGDKDQPIIFRFFPYSDIPNIEQTIQRIKNCNFEFLVLNRNDTIAQVLSYGMALATDVWTVNNEGYTPPTVEIRDFELMVWLYQSIKNFPNWLDSLGITYDVVNYETAVSELFNYLGRPVYNVRVTVKKQSDSNIWNYIINKKEVEIFLESLKNETYVY